MQKYLTFSPDGVVTPKDQRARECDFEDLKRLGTAADNRMATLADASTGREELTLAAMLVAEFATNSQVAPGYVDRVLAPIIDRIAAGLPSSDEVHFPKDEIINEAARLAHHAERYHNLVSALMNTAKGRMHLVEAPSGRLIFEPSPNGVAAELRDKWMYVRWHRSRLELGAGLATQYLGAGAVVDRLDRHVSKHMESRSVPAPEADWWVDHVGQFAERVLDGQFAEVESNEQWGGGLTGGQAKAALKPLLSFAISTMLTNIRAFQMRAAHGHQKAAAILHSSVPILSGQELKALFTAGGLKADQAESWMRAFVRTTGGERQSLHSHPIIEITNDQFALLPSALASANLSLIVQQQLAGPTLGAARCARHTQEVAQLFRDHGFAVATDVDLVVKGQPVTDLDVLAASSDGNLVVVLQLKSFVPRSNLLELERAAAYVSEASVQCDKAIQHRDVVEKLVESKLGISVAADWQLHQFIVVDLVAGSAELEPYPTLSLEWLRSEGPDALAAGLDEFVKRATDLPDGEDWFKSVRPSYGVMDLGSSEPIVGHRIAICDYWAPPPEPRGSPST